MAEKSARVSVIDQTKGTKYTVLLPTGLTTGQVLPQLVKQLKMPLQGPGGAPRQYDLMLETGEGLVCLEEDQTLAEAGVQEGTVLRLIPVLASARDSELFAFSRDSELTSSQLFERLRFSESSYWPLMEPSTTYDPPPLPLRPRQGTNLVLETLLGVLDRLQRLEKKIEGIESALQAVRTVSDFLETIDTRRGDLAAPFAGFAETGMARAWLQIDQEMEAFGEEQERVLIDFLAKRTGISAEEIKLVHVVPGNVIVTIELPVDAARRLLMMYFDGNPVISELNIKRVEIRELEPLPEGSRKLLPPTGPYVDYELGLRRLREGLTEQPSSVHSDFSIFEARLLGYLENERRYGPSETSLEGRTRVIYQLNALVARAGLGSSFTELCRGQ